MKSQAVKSLQGNAGRKKRRVGVGDAGRPEMPGRFQGKAAYVAAWKELVQRLEAAKVLTAQDGVALEMLTVALVNYRKVEADLEKNGYTHTTKNGYEQIRPCVTMCKIRHQQLATLLVQFGLTPVSRGKAERAGDLEADPLDEFLGR